MFEIIGEIRKRLSLGEDSTLEFKNGAIARRSGKEDWHGLADEIAAFANSNGGSLVFGVNKNREVTGLSVEQIELIESRVVELCTDTTEPRVNIHTRKDYLPGLDGEERPVLFVHVPRSLWVHGSPHGYFERQGSSKRKMSPDILARLMQQRSQARLIRFDEQIVPESSVADLEKDLWQPLVARSAGAEDDLLMKCRLLVEDRGQLHASVGGILMCAGKPEKFLPNAFIEAVRYRGTRRDSHYQIDARQITGPLNRQVDEAMHFLARNQCIAAVKKPYREETPQFADRAVFEAIVNAVAHRDYSVHGSKIRFFMFDDRLEIYSPGAPPNTISVDNMHLRQATRNELVTSLLGRCRVATDNDRVRHRYYLERRGEGVPTIIEESEKLSGRRPQYRLIDNSELLLTIYAYQP